MTENDRTTPRITLRVKGPGAASPSFPTELMANGESRVVGLKYKEVEKGADVATIEIDNFDLTYPDVPTFDVGNSVFLAWGYPGNMSPERECVVIDWTPGTTFVVEAHGRAMTMNRLPRKETYEGVKYSDVARKIAERNGFSGALIDIEDTEIVHEHVLQPSWTDLQLLRYMAGKAGMVTYIDQTGFHFHRRRLGGKPRASWAYYRDGAGDLLEYPKFDKSPRAQPGAVKLTGKDAKTGKPFEVTADNKSTAGREGLAPVLETFDRETGKSVLREKAATEMIAGTAAPNEAAAKKEAAALFKAAASNPKTGSVPVLGDPLFTAKSVFSMTGIGERLSGNYYAKEVVHEIKPGDYKMQVKFQRDGLSSTGGGGAKTPSSNAKTNTTPGQSGGGDGGKLEERETFDRETGQSRVQYLPPGGGKT